MPTITETLSPAYAGSKVTASLEQSGYDLANDITYPVGAIASGTIAAGGTYSLTVPDLSLLTPAGLTLRIDGPPGRRYITVGAAGGRVEDLLTDPPGAPESAALAVHAAAADPHAGYLTTAEGDAAYQPLDAVLTATTASFLVADETKLDGIEAGATADQTATLNTVVATGAAEDLAFGEAASPAVHDITMDEDCTFTFSGASSGVWSMTVILRGAFTPTFPASVDWPDGAAPTYGSPSVFEFLTVDSGTTVFGFLAGASFA